jgi:hypothetical protein
MTKDLFAGPSAARMYDYFLGGKDNYQVDRDAADRVMAMGVDGRLMARVNREFMRRVVGELTETFGIRQFLDIGAGIPTQPNLHQIAQAAAPEARVVYVDNDPIVLAHAHALMVGSPNGKVDFIDADFNDPARILDALGRLGTLDLRAPVALSLIALLHFVPDDSNPRDTIATLMDALAPGSYLVITQATADYRPELFAETTKVYERGGVRSAPRSLDEFTRFFDGLTLVDPGVVPPHRWRPAGISRPAGADAQVSMYAGVARKPR